MYHIQYNEWIISSSLIITWYYGGRHSGRSVHSGPMRHSVRSGHSDMRGRSVPRGSIGNNCCSCRSAQRGHRHRILGNMSRDGCNRLLIHMKKLWCYQGFFSILKHFCFFASACQHSQVFVNTFFGKISIFWENGIQSFKDVLKSKKTLAKP